MTLTIGQAIGQLAEEEPGAVAIRCGTEVVTRRELDEMTNQLARRWIAHGVQIDDLVTISLSNSVDFVLACVAAWKAGATPQPLSPRLPEADRSAIIELARPALVIVGELDRASSESDLPLEPLAAASWKAPTSSGSTGRPKIIKATAGAYVDPWRPFAPFVPHRAVQLVAGPLFHAAPFVYAMRGLMTGHQVIVMPSFDPDTWLRLVQRHRVSWAMVVPTMMTRIWASDERAATDVSSLESILHLGARCPPEVKRSWIRWLGPDRVNELYAGTESQGLALINGRDWLEHPGSVGKPISGTQFRIARDGGGWADPGELGEILMRRDVETYQYLGSEATIRDGWHSLGDAGWIDADGWLYVADRIDDAITTGGVTVHPADIEMVLESHPSVRGAVVVGCPDSDVGERIHAIVHWDGTADDEVDFDSWIARRLDAERRPRTMSFVDHRLRDDTGKIRRGAWRSSCAQLD